MSFAAIAPRVLYRVLLRQWLASLTAQAPWMLSLLVLLWLAHLFWQGPVTLIFSSIVLWLGSSAVRIWRGKPDAYESLAAWDKSTGRTEDFAAAWWYEQQANTSPLQQRHIETQLKKLAACLPSLKKDLPLPLHPLQAAVLALAMLPVLFMGTPPTSEAPLDAATREAISAEVARLVHKPLEEQPISNLTGKEQAALKALQDQIRTSAADLKKSSSASARDVLGLLDNNARAAESLADQLVGSQQDWASRVLTAALQQHTDTADLGDATASRKPTDLAAAARVLVDLLRQPLLPPQVLERLDAAFNDCARKAEPVDKERYVGRPVVGAAEDLHVARADEAATKLEALAAQMQDLAQREAAKKELQTLAQHLRDSGNSDPSNNGPADKAGGMKQMQASAQQKSGGAIPKVNQTQADASQSVQNANAVPSAAQGRSQVMTAAVPQDATGNAQPSQGQAGGQMSGRLQRSSGSQPSDPSRPRLIAPIPGQPGNLPTNALLVVPNLPAPPGGAAGLLPFAGARPGNSTADLNAKATQSAQAKQASTVSAVAGQDGSSSTKKIEGQSTSEAMATQPVTEQTLQQVQREEAALDDLPLPANRREHVRRYFIELRKRFEEK